MYMFSRILTLLYLSIEKQFLLREWEIKNVNRPDKCENNFFLSYKNTLTFPNLNHATSYTTRWRLKTSNMVI
jgi:hypothetical protein